MLHIRNIVTVATVYSKFGSEQAELPGVVSFQACGPVYVSTGPRLANSSQVLVIFCL